MRLVSELCNVAVSTLYIWWHQFIENGSWEPPVGFRHRHQWTGLDPDSLFLVLGALDRTPMLYLDELKQMIQQNYGRDYSTSNIQHAIEQQGYTRKCLEYRALEQNQSLKYIM
jgi:transposase